MESGQLSTRAMSVLLISRQRTRKSVAMAMIGARRRSSTQRSRARASATERCLRAENLNRDGNRTQRAVPPSQLDCQKEAVFPLPMVTQVAEANRLRSC
jgi:hypothetical protein